jgi:hypothetical protein
MIRLDILDGIIQRIGEAIDRNVTTDAERLELLNELNRMQLELSSKVLEANLELQKQRASLIKAEAEGGSWLQRNWRPVTALTFLVLQIEITNEMWDLLQVMIGGYVVSRGIEKAAPSVAEVLRR